MVNPEKAEYRKNHPVNSDAFSLGTDFHNLVLCGKTPADDHNIAVSPYSDFRKAEAKGWKKEQELSGKKIIKESELNEYTNQLNGMADAVYTLEDFVVEADEVVTGDHARLRIVCTHRPAPNTSVRISKGLSSARAWLMTTVC